MDFVNLKKILQEIKDDRKCMVYLAVAIFYFLFSVIWVLNDMIPSAIWTGLGILYVYMFKREISERRKEIAEAI